MKTYVWEYLSRVTSSYHSGGGVLIITDIDPQDEWKEYRQNKINSGEVWDDNDQLIESLPEPDFSYDCASEFKRILVFPDEGCC